MILAAAMQAPTYSGLTSSYIPANLQSEPAQRITVVNRHTGSTNSDSQDTITLSQGGLNRSRQGQGVTGAENSEEQPIAQGGNSNPSSPQQLSAEEQQAVLKLKQRDIEVKSHEAAHLANAGQYAAGGPSYTYQTGPDGKRYAVGGEVPIDVGKERTPEQTIQKMRIVRRAAMAPANPSSADRSIAAAAGMAESEALRELNTVEEDSNNAESPENISAISSPDAPTENSSQQPQSRLDFQATYA